MSGYPHIDKPWEKFYVIDNKTSVTTTNTIYENFKIVTDQKCDSLAIVDNFSGKKYTYVELLQEVDCFANGLLSLGLGVGSRVGMLGFNALVDPIVFLASNKIGASVMFLAPEDGPKDIAKFVELLDAIVIENIFIEMEPIINPDEKPAIVWGDAEASRPNCIVYNELISKNDGAAVPVKYEKDRPSLIIFSSGSTGAPKPIVHSDYSINCAVRNMQLTDFPFNDENLLIKIIPSHIGLGSITTMITGLLSGVPYIQIKGMPNPVIDLAIEAIDIISNFKLWLSKNNLSNRYGLLFFAAPYFAKEIHNVIDSIEDLSFIKAILLGGSKMDKGDLDAFDKTFRDKGLSVPIGNGYGQNELGGAVALNTVNHNFNGSAGYPVYGTTVRIVDRDTLEDLPFNSEGIILEQSDSKFLYYLNMPEKTEETIVCLSDGTCWYNSTDLGYMNEDGYIFITGRTTRTIIKSDHKVSLESVEEKIYSLDFIKEVAVVPMDDDGNTVTFISTNNSIDENQALTIINSDECGLSLFEKTEKVVIVNEIPRMDNGKINYVLLNEQAKQM